MRLRTFFMLFALSACLLLLFCKVLILMPQGTSIGDLVRALNAIGVSPRDLITVFQAIKASGALQAELEII